MFMRLFSFLFFTLALPAFSQQLSSEELAACDSQWREWQKTFTSSSPFGANKKLYSDAVGEQQFQQLFSQMREGTKNIEVRMERPLPNYDMSTGKTSEVTHIPVADLFSRENLAKEIKEKADRDSLLVASLAQMVRQNPKDNLLVVSLGQAHILDYFLHDGASRGVMFGSQRIDNTTTIHSKGYRQFAKSLHKSLQPLFLGAFNEELNNELAPESARYFLPNSAQLTLEKVREAEDTLPHWTPEKLMGGESNPGANVLLVGEIHHVYDLIPIHKLPSARCLKAKAFSSVTFILEGLPRLKTGVSLDFIRSSISYKSYASSRSVLVDKKVYAYSELLRRFSPPAKQILEREIVEPYAASIELATMERLKSEGMAVHVGGIEPELMRSQEGSNLIPSNQMVDDFRRWSQLSQKIQIARGGLSKSGSTGFARQLTPLWNEIEALEEQRLSKYPVIPLPPTGELSRPQKFDPIILDLK